MLISLLLLSVALFGIDVLEVSSLRDASHTYYFNVAINQLNDMAARLREPGRNNNYTDQLTLWNAENKLLLPGGTGEVTDNQIKLCWNKQNAEQPECLSATVRA